MGRDIVYELTAEYMELNVRVERLAKAIGMRERFSVPEGHIVLMEEQLDGMLQYRAALKARINDLKGDN